MNEAPDRIRWRFGRDEDGKLVLAMPHRTMQLKIYGGCWIRKTLNDDRITGRKRNVGEAAEAASDLEEGAVQLRPGVGGPDYAGERPGEDGDG